MSTLTISVVGAVGAAAGMTAGVAFRASRRRRPQHDGPTFSVDGTQWNWASTTAELAVSDMADRLTAQQAVKDQMAAAFSTLPTLDVIATVQPSDVDRDRQQELDDSHRAFIDDREEGIAIRLDTDTPDTGREPHGSGVAQFEAVEAGRDPLEEDDTFAFIPLELSEAEKANLADLSLNADQIDYTAFDLPEPIPARNAL